MSSYSGVDLGYDNQGRLKIFSETVSTANGGGGVLFNPGVLQ